MADKPDNRKLVTSLEDAAVEVRALTTMALAMFDETESTCSVEERRDFREALGWCLLELRKRGHGWREAITAATLRVDRPAAH